MISQVIVNVDSKLKNQAMKKARAKGLPFSVVLNSMIRAFVKGQVDVEVQLKEELNLKTRREMIRISKDIAQGKNLSPNFTSADEAMAYLRS